MTEEKQSLSLPVAIVAAALIIGGALFFTRSGDFKKTDDKKGDDVEQNNPTNNVGSAPAPVTDKDHILGDPNAPVTLLVYTDLECPYCRRFHEGAVKSAMDEYGKAGKINLVYRNFPLPATMHPNAMNFAMGAECAADVGGPSKYWEFIDSLFAGEVTDITKIAQTTGLNAVTFKSCVGQEKFAQKIKEDMASASKVGISSTPSFIFIKKDGTATPAEAGALPYESFKPLIEAALN